MDNFYEVENFFKALNWEYGPNSLRITVEKEGHDIINDIFPVVLSKVNDKYKVDIMWEDVNEYTEYHKYGLYGTYWTGYSTEFEYNEEYKFLKISSNDLIIIIFL